MELLVTHIVTLDYVSQYRWRSPMKIQLTFYRYCNWLSVYMETQQHIFLTIKCFILFLNFIYLSISLFLIALSTKCMNRVETICICRMYIVYGTRYSLTHLMNSGDIIVWANYTKHTPNYMQKTYRSYIFTDNVLRKYMSADFIWRVIRLCIAFTPFHTCECGVFDVTDL